MFLPFGVIFTWVQLWKHNPKGSTPRKVFGWGLGVMASLTVLIAIVAVNLAGDQVSEAFASTDRTPDSIIIAEFPGDSLSSFCNTFDDLVADTNYGNAWVQGLNAFQIGFENYDFGSVPVMDVYERLLYHCGYNRS